VFALEFYFVLMIMMKVELNSDGKILRWLVKHEQMQSTQLF